MILSDDDMKNPSTSRDFSNDISRRFKTTCNIDDDFETKIKENDNKKQQQQQQQQPFEKMFKVIRRPSLVGMEMFGNFGKNSSSSSTSSACSPLVKGSQTNNNQG